MKTTTKRYNPSPTLPQEGKSSMYPTDDNDNSMLVQGKIVRTNRSGCGNDEQDGEHGARQRKGTASRKPISPALTIDRAPGGRTPRRRACNTTMGSLPASFPQNSPLQKGVLNRRIVFSVLSAVMPLTKARELAGYVERSTPVVIDPQTVQGIREKLQSVAGVTLADQVLYYAGVRENDEEDTSSRLTAARAIDRVLGYDAPQKVEVAQQTEIRSVHAVFHKLCSQTGLKPRDLIETGETSE